METNLMLQKEDIISFFQIWNTLKHHAREIALNNRIWALLMEIFKRNAEYEASQACSCIMYHNEIREELEEENLTAQILMIRTSPATDKIFIGAKCSSYQNPRFVNKEDREFELTGSMKQTLARQKLFVQFTSGQAIRRFF